MINSFKKFYSKILLFGEYAIINGSEGLAIPLDSYYMQFTFEKDAHVFERSNELLVEYLKYVQLHTNNQIYNLLQFEKDIQKGLLVSSTIPIGYGIGSSGALVACFFDAYCIDKNHFESIDVLKKELGLLESYFHGASSGLDPLVSYLHQTVHIQSDGTCKAFAYNPTLNKTLSLFLVNSAIERRTAPLVAVYKEKLQKDSSFKSIIENQLFSLNHKIIQAYLAGDSSTYMQCFKEIATLQFMHFKEMIPSSIQSLFNQEAYTMKICGAGGGGFFLGMGDASAIKEYAVIPIG
ncbi:MAG: mevalonate kinase [Bacteroidota bacterium]